MKPERLFPMILVILGAAFFFSAYRTKTESVRVPDELIGNRGPELFYQHQCITCHWVSALPDARGKLGPGLDDIGNRAAKYDAGNNGEDYIRESILNPSKVVRPGFVNGMPSFEGKLSDEDMDALVDWLLELKEEKPEQQ